MKQTKKRLDKYDGCQNMFGDLPMYIIERLETFLNDPSEENWNDAYPIIIGNDGWMTFWQAVIAVDPSFPRSAGSNNKNFFLPIWERVPDFFTARRALEYARTFKK